jgi:uncharacterized protein (TIGR02145 family)
MYNIPYHFGCLILIIACILNVQAQTISSVNHFQEGQIIRIVYELQTTTPVEIQVTYSKDFGKTFSSPLKQVSGAVGKGVTEGSKEIIWRVLEEVPELVGEGIVFRVSIAGGQWRPGMVHCNNTPTEIVEVRNPVTGRVWMDRNLGASRAATSSTDEAAYGDLYQWGRFGDGHQCRSSATTRKMSSKNAPGHGFFILVSDWLYLQNNNLWQALDGINNPCPTSYRLPTESEWEAERRSWSSNSSEAAMGSALKLPLAGYRFYYNGSLGDLGTSGYYWSNSVSDSNARFLNIKSDKAFMHPNNRVFGFSVRCIQDL